MAGSSVTRRMVMCTVHAKKVSRGICLFFIGLVTPGLLGLVGCASTAYQSSGSVSSEIDDGAYLSSYGEWFEVRPYGMVWRPYVVADWEPFYYGHWMWTADGWAWTSYEPYGWLVYHYGYWGYQPGIGWFWVPGDVWSPARVQWCTFDEYAAWAPIPPPGITWIDPWDPYDVNVWIVVDIDLFTNENIGRYRVVRPPHREIVMSRTIRREPPDVRRVERSSGEEVPQRRIDMRTVRVRRPSVSDQATAAKKSDSEVKRMVLPRSEERKVEKHAPTVERKVLTPKKNEPVRQKESSERKREPVRRSR
jgi:hypothetical protein